MARKDEYMNGACGKFWAPMSIRDGHSQPGNPREQGEKHPGFAKVQNKIQKEGYSKEAAGAILANATRNASPAAKKANPNLKHVNGKRG